MPKAMCRGASGKLYPCSADHWNPHGLSEVIVTFDDGSRDSVYFEEIEPVPPMTRDELRDALNALER